MMQEDKIGNQQTQGDETRVVDIEEEDELLKEATIADAMENGEVDSPTVVPKLVLVEDKNEDGESLETDVEQTVSYTGLVLFLVIHWAHYTNVCVHVLNIT